MRAPDFPEWQTPRQGRHADDPDPVADSDHPGVREYSDDDGVGVDDPLN